MKPVDEYICWHALELQHWSTLLRLKPYPQPLVFINDIIEGMIRPIPVRINIRPNQKVQQDQAYQPLSFTIDGGICIGAGSGWRKGGSYCMGAGLRKGGSYLMSAGSGKDGIYRIGSGSRKGGSYRIGAGSG